MSEHVHKPPLVSIVVGLVSTLGRETVFELLRSLERDRGAPRHEVVLAHRRGDPLTERLARGHPDVRLVTMGPDATLPQMRTAAFAASRGTIIVVTEDHCVPEAGWLHALTEPLKFAAPEVFAVGGPVRNGAAGTALDSATFLFEYAGVLPLRGGGRAPLPGMNVAYRRAALERFPSERLASGFWESLVHPELVRGGGRYLTAESATLWHHKPMPLGFFLRQRYIMSRNLAGNRFAARSRTFRLLLAPVVFFGLPPLLLLRLARDLGCRGRIGSFLASLPFFVLFVGVAATGEAVGVVTGSVDGLQHVE